MKRPVIAIALLALTLGAARAGGGAASQGPPAALARSLTPNGRVIWNLDALLNDTFGSRVDCFDSSTIRLFSAQHGSGCPGPSARYQTYVFTFLNARRSQFRLVSAAKTPNTGATNTPLRVGRRYVSCPSGQYHHSGRGWLVFGGGAGPNGLFWCD